MALTHVRHGDAVVWHDENGLWVGAQGPVFPDIFDTQIKPPDGASFWRTDFKSWYSWDRITQGWAAVEAGPETFDKGGNVLSPTAPLNVAIWQAPFACVVTKVSGYRVGGSGATVNARRNGSAAHLAAALSLTSADTWMADEGVQNVAYAEDDSLEIQIVTAAGSPTQVAVLVEFRRS